MTAKEFYQAGKLTEAIAAATEDVKAKPTDGARRLLLAELLCFAGDLARADLQLDAVAQQDPKALMHLSLFRQNIRAEQARGQFFAEGRVPEFLDQPTEAMRLYLEASIRLREAKPAEAAELLAKAEAKRPRVRGTCDGQPFEDLRDLDDVLAGVFEVFTSTGKYYWVPIERVELLEFHAPERPRDLLWRRAHMVVGGGGPDGEVAVAALYAGSHADADDRVRLGRATDWQVADGQPVRGKGQRTFLVGENDRGILELSRLEITQKEQSAVSRVRADQPLLPSVLDRLIDREPGSPRDRGDAQVLRDMKQSVRRDLENLLNTRWRCASWPPDLNELKVSLVNYGIPDFTGWSMSDGVKREEFRQIVERVIRKFEPRFKTVRVILVSNPEPMDRTLRFRIDALMHASPAPEPVVFDTALEPVTTNFEVKRVSR